MIKQKLKAALPRRVQIIERSPYEIAQLYQDKCQPLRTHILAKMQTHQNSISPSKVNYLAKKIDVDEFINKTEEKDKNKFESLSQKNSRSISEHFQVNSDNSPQNIGLKTKQLIEQAHKNKDSQHQDEKISDSQNENKNDQKFKKFSISLHDSIIDDQYVQKHSNIFENSRLYQKLSKNEEVGPKLNKDGKIIPYSIVGKPQWYIKELIKENEKNKTSKQSDYSGCTQKRNDFELNDCSFNSQDINQSDNKLTKTHIYPLPWYKQEDKTFISDIKFMRRKKKEEQMLNQGQERKDLYCEKNMSESQVKKKIQQEEDRLLLNQSRQIENNKNILSGLSVEEKMILTREERILNRHKRQENQFDQLVQRQTKDLQREPNQSILLSGEQYRKKIETIKAFEIVKPIDKKHGETYWNKMLRQYPYELSELNAARPEWYPNNKNERIKEESLEIIHKKRSVSMNAKNTSKNTLNGTFNTFKSGNYAQKKLNETQDEWNYDQVKHIQEENYDQQKSIEIVGVNKFQQEKDSILSYSKERDSILSYQNEKKPTCFKNITERKQTKNVSLQNSNINESQIIKDEINGSNISPEKHKMQNGSGINGLLSFKAKFLKKYTLNDEYKYQKFQSKGSSILDEPHHEITSSKGSFVQINASFLNTLKNKNLSSNFEEQNIQGEEVIHAQWQDRQILAKTGKFVFKKTQLMY